MNKKEQNKNKNKNEEKKNKETESKQQPDLTEALSTLKLTDLPVLTKSWLRRAARPERIEIIREFMAFDRLGMFEWFDMGFMLQNAGPNRLRCVHVYDDPISIQGLASVAQTISLAGGILELDQYTVVAPMSHVEYHAPAQETNVPNKEARVSGMEVA